MAYARFVSSFCSQRQRLGLLQASLSSIGSEKSEGLFVLFFGFGFE
jgi:hypothetical protein